MSAKKRRHGTVEAPHLSDLHIDLPHDSKKPRLDCSDPPLSPSGWSVEQVADYLRKTGLDEDVSKAFEGEVEVLSTTVNAWVVCSCCYRSFLLFL